MQDSQVQEIQKSLGETLGELRKQRNLSTQEVANQLRLDLKIIEALEADNYEVLPSPAYIRGYLRNYAKLLSIDSDRIISLYNHKAPQPPEIIPDVKHPTQVSSSDKPVKAVTYLVTFILVLLLLAWLQSNIVIKEVPVPQNSATDEPAIDFSYELDPYEGPELITEPAQPEGQGELAEPVVNRESQISNETAEAPVTEGAGVMIEPVSEQVEEGIEQNGGSIDLKVDDTRSPVADGTEGPDTISMKLTADSWIEIFDANDSKLLVTLGRSGDEISLRGIAPFKIKLGFSQGVTLYFNGDYFDPAPYSVGGVATFTLGE